MAHEIRTPLTSMLTIIELLTEDLDRLEPAQIQQMMTTFHRNTLWLQQFVESLPSLAPAPQPGDARDRVPVCLRAMLRAIDPVVQPILATQQQSLTIQGPAMLPAVLVDPQQLGQVYVNLLTNASKFAAAGTSIRVHFLPVEGGVRVAVEDRGPGIPRDALPHPLSPTTERPLLRRSPGPG